MAFFGAAERLACDLDRDENRRKTGRLTVHDIKCNLGTVLDLSSGGMRLKRRPWNKRLLANQYVRIELDAGSVRLVIVGELRWTRPLSKTADEVGMEFVMVDDDSRQVLNALAAQCCRHELTGQTKGRVGLNPQLYK